MAKAKKVTVAKAKKVTAVAPAAAAAAVEPTQPQAQAPIEKPAPTVVKPLKAAEPGPAVDDDPNEGATPPEPLGRTEQLGIRPGQENLSLAQCNAINRRQNKTLADGDAITNTEIRQMLRGRRPLRAPVK